MACGVAPREAHNVIARILLFAVLLPVLALAQQPSNAKKAAAATAPTPKPQGLTVEGIVSMVEAGISEDVIIALTCSR